eukprot:7106980-Ditylum_brightwellii.AAC.1
MENFYNVIKSGSERDESTILESDDASVDAFACASDSVQAVTVIGYAYGLQSFGSVMPEVLPPVVKILSRKNASSSDTANTQKAVYSDVETLHTANKRPNSAITIAVRDIPGETDKVEFEFKSNNQSDSCQEQSANRCSVSITGTVGEEINCNESPNLSSCSSASN